jgi:hypothetical protein
MARADRIDKLIAAWQPRLRRAFEDSIFALRENAEIEQIARMLERDDIEGAIRAVGLDPVAFRPFDREITAAFEAGGNATARIVPVTRAADGLRTVFQFNIRNPTAERWLAQRSSTQVTEILDDQRTMIRDYLRAGMEAGNNPRTVALDLVGRVGASGRREGGVIGLTSSQVEWVQTYSAELASDNPLDALSRSLRDKRFDVAVRKAAASGEPIPAALRGKMVDAYENRALRYRAESISRTEAIASLHEAQQQSIEQAVQSGAISRTDVKFIWRATHDNRTRDSHAEMDGQEVAMGEMFITGDGNALEFPGDPNGPPEEIINCRCWREPSVDFLAGIE